MCTYPGCLASSPRTLTSVRVDFDAALDDIISTKRKQNPRPRPSKQSSAKKGKGAKAAALGGSTAAAVSNANRQQPPVTFPGRNQKGPGSKVIVSNLPVDVTEAQVKVRFGYCSSQELFSTTIGPLRRALMSYKANGQSTGVVTVEFQRAEDANRAYAQYNNRLIDSKRPLKIEVVVDPARAPAATAQPAKPAQPKARKSRSARSKRAARPVKTAEDLDAEMEDYSRQGAAESAPMQQDAQPQA